MVREERSGERPWWREKKERRHSAREKSRCRERMGVVQTRRRVRETG